MKFSVILLWITFSAFAQDTINTNYPNTTQRWEKIFEQQQKIKESIYYKSGQEWMTVKYDSTQRESWKWYHQNGEPYFEATIINELLEGEYKIWYESGQLAERLFFVNNLENGSAEFYHKNGQIAMRGFYKDGKMIGVWEFFNEKGEKDSGEWHWYFAALPNRKRMSGFLRNGQQMGQWTYYSTAGPGDKMFNIYY